MSQTLKSLNSPFLSRAVLVVVAALCAPAWAADDALIEGEKIKITVQDMKADALRMPAEMRPQVLGKPQTVTQIASNLYARRAMALRAEADGLEKEPAVIAALRIARDKVLSDAYLEKPFHKEELLLRIRKLLELRKNLQQLYIKQAGLVVPQADEVQTTSPEPIAAIQKTEDDFVKKVTQVIEAHFTDEQFTVEQLCKQVYMSHSQLHRKLEALTGCSPNKFIRMIRLNRATTLLQDPSLTISSIALECGYNDPGYFARVFKQEYGITPQEWRVRRV